MGAFFSVNFTAEELENPFGTMANNLPLDEFRNEIENAMFSLGLPLVVEVDRSNQVLKQAVGLGEDNPDLVPDESAFPSEDELRRVSLKMWHGVRDKACTNI